METTTSKNSGDVIAVNVPRRVDTPSVDRKSDFQNVDIVENSKDFQSYLYPMRDVIELDSNSVEHEKRSEEYDRHTNEVIKQASIMTSSASSTIAGLVKTLNSVICLSLVCTMMLLQRRLFSWLNSSCSRQCTKLRTQQNVFHSKKDNFLTEKN